MRSRLTEHAAHPCLIGPPHRGAVGPTYSASAATHRAVTATADSPPFARPNVTDRCALLAWGPRPTVHGASRLAGGPSPLSRLALKVWPLVVEPSAGPRPAGRDCGGARARTLRLAGALNGCHL